ncbi:Dipeptide transport system permease protein dppB [Pseudorhizobium banfieldiae]|uniref:Dipeptide transport system permease protein dppB n=1 Tax=Pseudorhizobium banfieldiae TaxID=1125847 RepID=L0ND76_9HYPH|nr:ABC transporter permease [Pseudorhizobium banfieldiae]CAD6603602.1 ABC transporter permease [arsenite-oxidising bacterium NT-25]CAD6610295.1 ABC transporter permease [Rhizobium sp. TCK]CCF18756.1 Dipeptide transport system permease protein dppB [Pseudorhizobium banfieldiae]
MRLGTLVERLLQLIPVLLGVSLIVFLMLALTPGDPVEIMIGDQNMTAEQEALLRSDLGLDRPLPERFLSFVGNALQGEFGTSFFHRRPVLDVIVERLPATIELSLVAMVIALATAIPLGVAAAIHKNTIIDRIATVGSLFGVSLPGFWFGILLLMLFAVHLRLLPVSGRIGFDSEVPMVTGFLLIDTLVHGRFYAFWDALRHIVLPAITLGLPMTAILTRVTRTAMLEVMRQDYVAFAEAKGISRHRILYRHALKNALIPTVSVAAIETGSLLGGNMIVETVFGWPGLGRLVVESIFVRNYPLVQAAVLLYAVTYVLMNFVADILYTVLNPRVKL